MRQRKLVFLASLGIAVAELSPAAALAKAGGTHRPIRSRGNGIGTLNLQTGAFSATTTELVSHLGKVHGHDVGAFVVTGPGRFATTFNFTVVTRNGDEISGFANGTGTFTPAGSDGTLVATFTGGTGRFADATGGTMGSLHTTTISSNGAIVAVRTMATLRGHISY
jgi:hypothetical protein